MTGLINRMVQRARGTLPGVEPLIRSHKTAASALGMRVEQNFAGASPSSPLASESKQSPSPTSSSQSTLPADDRVPLVAGTLQSHADDRLGQSEQGLIRAELPHPTEPGSPQPSAPRPSRDPIILEVHAVKQALHEAISEQSAIASQADDSRSPQDTSSLRPREIAKAQQEPRLTRAQQMDSAAASPLESATEHTEIHVTIGSIELRAPRAETPRQAAPFKPRVTLDDYLRGRSGAKS